MPYVNSVSISGNIGSDARRFDFKDGGFVLDFSVAVSEKWTDKGGEAKESTTWVTVKAFSSARIHGIDSLDKLLVKGAHVVVNGKLKTESWDDEKTGSRQTKMVVHAISVGVAPRNEQSAGDGTSAKKASGGYRTGGTYTPPPQGSGPGAWPFNNDSEPSPF